MLNFDLSSLDTQRIGRMGELVVELGLLSRGWIVGNFNATTLNSAGWDLFACKGERSVRIRVKAKRPGTTAFRWSAKSDGSVLAGLSIEADDDYVAAVSFEAAGNPEIYLIPSQIVEEALTMNHARWLSGAKRDGSSRKDTSMRNLYLDDRPDLGPAHGFISRWECYRSNWDDLDRRATA